MRLPATVGSLVLASVLSVPAAAQESTGSGERVVRGLVVDSISGQPLNGVTFYFDGRKDEFFSGSEGQFRIAGVRLRDTLLVMRRIGFVPQRVSVPRDLSPVAIDMGRIALKPVATKLDQIAVEAEEINRFPQLTDFYRRKQNNTGGVFITRDDIQRTAARNTSDMLRRTAKVEMDCTNDRSGADNCIARNRRGRNVIRPSATQTGQRRAQIGTAIPEDTGSMDFGMDRCEMQVYVDGMRSSIRVDEVPLHWIGGIEVYSGLATTPPGLGNGRCGVVAIWTTTTVDR